VNEGDSVDFGKPVYSIVNDEKRFVRFFVRESDLVFIERNAEISFSPTSTTALQFPAKIVRIAPSLDRDTRTVLIEADLEPSEKNEKILAHMNVRIQIPVSNDPSLSVLPEKALELSDGKSVWIVNEKVEIEKLPISVRFIHDGYAYVEGDFDKAWVVTKSPVELNEGLAVETTL
jgi:multidrug efflux pump subunit AcrA (membrane-fusion protein)